MAKIIKLVEKMLRLPAAMRFEEVVYVLEYFGYHLENVKGSHFIYMKNGKILTIVKKVKRVKRGYIREIVDMLDLEAWYEQKKK